MPFSGGVPAALLSYFGIISRPASSATFHPVRPRDSNDNMQSHQPQSYSDVVLRGYAGPQGAGILDPILAKGKKRNSGGSVVLTSGGASLSLKPAQSGASVPSRLGGDGVDQTPCGAFTALAVTSPMALRFPSSDLAATPASAHSPRPGAARESFEPMAMITDEPSHYCDEAIATATAEPVPIPGTLPLEAVSSSCKRAASAGSQLVPAGLHSPRRRTSVGSGGASFSSSLDGCDDTIRTRLSSSTTSTGNMVISPPLQSLASFARNEGDAPAPSEAASSAEELPHPCEMRGCKQRFATLLELQQHIISHAIQLTAVDDDNGDRKVAGGHACSLCGRIFKRRSDCLRHERSHKRERPFACLACEKRWTRRDALHKHLREHADCRFTHEIRARPIPMPLSQMQVTTPPDWRAFETAAAAAAALGHRHGGVLEHNAVPGTLPTPGESPVNLALTAGSVNGPAGRGNAASGNVVLPAAGQAQAAVSPNLVNSVLSPALASLRGCEQAARNSSLSQSAYVQPRPHPGTAHLATPVLPQQPQQDNRTPPQPGITGKPQGPVLPMDVDPTPAMAWAAPVSAAGPTAAAFHTPAVRPPPGTRTQTHPGAGGRTSSSAPKSAEPPIFQFPIMPILPARPSLDSSAYPYFVSPTLQDLRSMSVGLRGGQPAIVATSEGGPPSPEWHRPSQVVPLLKAQQHALAHTTSAPPTPMWPTSPGLAQPSPAVTVISEPMCLSSPRPGANNLSWAHLDGPSSSLKQGQLVPLHELPPPACVVQSDSHVPWLETSGTFIGAFANSDLAGAAEDATAYGLHDD